MRRRFQHLFEEISLAAGRLAPRYALWLRLHELGMDPERLSREEALRFCHDHLGAFLREHHLALGGTERRRLERAVARHDPSVRTPAEWAARL